MGISIKAPQGSIKKKRIVGRGIGSGNGKTSGKGHKGYKARSGGTINLGFEGGQMALIRRLPKVGFTNWPHMKEVAELTLEKLEKYFEANEEVNSETIKAKGLYGRFNSIKVIGGGELKKALKFAKGVRFTKSAKEAVQAAGGTIVE